MRLPLNEDCWLGINGAPAEYSAARYHEAVRNYVIRLREAGLYVILDLHWSAPGARLATGQQPMADLDHAPAFWSSVARTFKDDPAVVFDLYNEPYDVSWQCWRDGCLMPEGWRTAGMQTLVDAVRSTGASQTVIATGLGSGSDLSGWLEYRPRDPAHQLAAGLHMYDFSAPCDEPDCWATEVGPVAGQVPVVATMARIRVRVRSSTASRVWADGAGLSYLGWTWNPTGCDAPALIKSWDGLPSPRRALSSARTCSASDWGWAGNGSPPKAPDSGCQPFLRRGNAGATEGPGKAANEARYEDGENGSPKPKTGDQPQTPASEAALLEHGLPPSSKAAPADPGRSRCYSGSVSPEPPNSSGKSLSLGRPSFMGSTVDS